MAAKTKNQSVASLVYRGKSKKKHGRHAKSKTSDNKRSKHYVKSSRGQGK